MSKVLIVDCGSMGISYDLILKQEGSTTTKIGIKKQAFEAILELEQQLKECRIKTLDEVIERLNKERQALGLSDKDFLSAIGIVVVMKDPENDFLEDE